MKKKLIYKGVELIVHDDGRVVAAAFERAYKDGRVFKYPERELKFYKDRGGYMITCIYRTENGVRSRINIKQHRIVAMAFIPNPDNLPQVNHKNEDKTDNRVENLEWCDDRYNVNYGTRTERDRVKKYNRGTKLMPCRPCVQMDMEGNVIKTYLSIKEATRETGVEHSTICRCCSGSRNTKTAGGYRWSYL